MARNEWINSYLEAILDVGTSNKKRFESNSKIVQKLGDMNRKEPQEKVFSPIKYFVEEVVNSFDESDLYKTWIKVIATRNTRERSNRLENICWRIWHLARKKKQIVWDDGIRLSKRRDEREKGRNDAEEDLSELSEGEKEKSDAVTTLEPPRDQMPRIRSEMQIWSEDDKSSRNLYIVLIRQVQVPASICSMHGLVRGENMELGRDSDTGGQVKYVVELARALANTEGVHRVDLLTRQISSPEVDSSYGEPVEMLSCPPEGSGSCGSYIIRIPCGSRDKYIAKESLWPHIHEFVDGALNHIVDIARSLGEQVNGGKPIWPYVIHGHYADAGEVAAHLAGTLNVPMVLTGHSLGRNKFEQLLKQGRITREDINKTYKIMRRIEAEELSLDAAEMVVTSTRQEIEAQWGLYDGFDIKLERKLRVRRRRGVTCFGRYMPRMVVIPPGMDFSYVLTQDSQDADADLKSLIGPDRNQIKKPVPPIWSEIMRFFTNTHKPTILALSRPDPKKNVTTLLKAFGECQPLRELANLNLPVQTLILGNRDDIEEMSNSSSVVLMSVLKLIDQYDLYGQVAYPKHHKQSEVPDIYRLAAKTKGVFINPALVEPFGLTLIEALNHGLLVDPHDQQAISDALLKLVANKHLWAECRKNGLKNIHRFSWPEHCRNYLSHVEHCRNRHPTSSLDIMKVPEEPISDSLGDVDDISLRFSMDGDFKLNGELDASTRQRKLVNAISQMNSMKGGPSALYSPGKRQMLFVITVDSYDDNGDTKANLEDVIKNVMKTAGLTSGKGKIGFVLATGSSVQEVVEMTKKYLINLEEFDAIVCNSGSEIYYPWRDMEVDADYEAHVEYKWPGESLRSTRRVDDLRQRLRMRGLRCNIVYTHAATRLNVIPLCASRLQAVRYLSIRWGIDMKKSVFFVGEKGDTDYEDLLGGLHKTIILKGAVGSDSEKLLRSEENFKREDVVPRDSPNISYVEENGGPPEMLSTLEAYGIK
ncbi:hypothetical protein YC2023_018375 [Brassica napus]